MALPCISHGCKLLHVLWEAKNGIANAKLMLVRKSEWRTNNGEEEKCPA
jgi:hypothetical protein